MERAALKSRQLAGSLSLLGRLVLQGHVPLGQVLLELAKPAQRIDGGN